MRRNLKILIEKNMKSKSTETENNTSNVENKLTQTDQETQTNSNGTQNNETQTDVIPNGVKSDLNDSSINSPQIHIPSNNDINISPDFKPADDHGQSDHEKDYNTCSEQPNGEECFYSESKFWKDFRIKLTADVNSLLAKGAT